VSAVTVTVIVHCLSEGTAGVDIDWKETWPVWSRW